MSTKAKINTNDEFKEKVIDILRNLNQLRRDIKALMANQDLFKHLRNSSDEVIMETFITEYKSSGKYDPSSLVEKEALHNMESKEITAKQVKKKRLELELEIEKCESKIKYKTQLIRIFENILNDMCDSDRRLIELTYIDKKRNRYTWEDIVMNYNIGRRYALSKQTIENRQKELIQRITDELKKYRSNISLITVYRLGG